MYEERAEPREFVADNRAEAVSKACSFYGIEEPELAIVQPPEGEIFGLAGRVVVVAVPPGRRAPDPREQSDDRGDRGGRDRSPRGDRDRGGRGRERGGRSERGGRGDRGERSDRGGRGDRGDRGDRGGRSERGGRPERGGNDREDQAALADEPAPDEPQEVTVRGELDAIGEFIQGVVERMQLGSFEISQSREDGFLVVELKGAAAERLASGDGRASDALQLLGGQFAMRTEEEPPRVVVDVEGDADGRESFLQRLAERAARRAHDTKRSIALDPMSPRDRRIVHVALRDLDDVATMSIGDGGRYRQVLVVPEGAAEYEDAQATSREAEERDRD